jgi:hypothetical protein
VLRDINEEADLARVSVLKNVPAHANAELQGTPIKGYLAHELAKNPKEEILECRIEGTFAVQLVDTRKPDGFRVQVRDLRWATSFSAILRSDHENVETRRVIERATFEKEPIYGTFNVRRKRGKIIDAWIVKASPVPGGWSAILTPPQRGTDSVNHQQSQADN